jgi:catechol 2,3-dioxygenase-like lactoylglutathione lyase family enzyme
MRTRVRSLDHVSVTAADLDASITFYRDVLGLALRDRGSADEPEIADIMGAAGARIEWAELDLGRGQVLELISFDHPHGSPRRGPLWDAGATHFGIGVDDIEATHRRCVEHGVETRSGPVTLTEAGDWNGVRVLYAVDPDGTWVELVQRPEGTEGAS